VWCESARTNPTGARFAFFLPTPTSGLDDPDDPADLENAGSGLDGVSATAAETDP
jgi:hypothetical protein